MASTISLNVSNCVTFKLTPKNYTLWCEQLLALAKSQDMVGLLTGEKEKPTMYNNTIADETSTNETKKNLRRIPQMVKRRSSPMWVDYWNTNKRSLGSHYWPRIITIILGCLKGSICKRFTRTGYSSTTTYISHKNPNQSLAEHLQNFKSICDNLATIGNPVPDNTKVYSLLANLGRKYEYFTMAMLKPPMPSYSEAVSLL